MLHYFIEEKNRLNLNLNWNDDGLWSFLAFNVHISTIYMYVKSRLQAMTLPRLSWLTVKVEDNSLSDKETESVKTLFRRCTDKNAFGQSNPNSTTFASE